MVWRRIVIAVVLTVCVLIMGKWFSRTISHSANESVIASTKATNIVIGYHAEAVQTNLGTATHVLSTAKLVSGVGA